MSLNKNSHKFTVSKAKSLVAEGVHPYIAYVLNASDWIVVGVYQNNSYRPIQPFGRTCSGDIQACVDQQKYVPISQSNCNEPSYSLALRVRDPRNGNEYQTDSATVRPDCGYAGEVIYLEVPLP